MTDTTGYVGIAANAALNTEWQQVVYSFEVVGSKFLCINISGMQTNAQFTNFELYPVAEVYDTRIAERELDYMTKLYNEPDFTQEKEQLAEVMAPFQELLANTTLSWQTDYKGVSGCNGYLLTSNKSGYTGKSIFLPAAGGRNGTSLYDQGSYGDYWSSSLSGDYPGSAWILGFYSGDANVYNGNRYYGFTVRPVQ